MQHVPESNNNSGNPKSKMASNFQSYQPGVGKVASNFQPCESDGRYPHDDKMVNPRVFYKGEQWGQPLDATTHQQFQPLRLDTPLELPLYPPKLERQMADPPVFMELAVFMCPCRVPVKIITCKKEGPLQGKLAAVCGRDGHCNTFFTEVDINNKRCGCNIPMSRLEVKKVGPNQGRHFYQCSARHCRKFVWDD
jgi:hypothetical protein